MPWREVRADSSVKETVFALLMQRHGDLRRPGGGQTALCNKQESREQGPLMLPGFPPVRMSFRM